MNEFLIAAQRAPRPDNWDPKESEKVRYRHATTGDEGWLVRRNGQDMIKLNRKAKEIIRPFNAVEWVPDREYRPLNRAGLAQICFEADREFCRQLGLHKMAKRDWRDLSQDEKISWMNEGPASPTKRAELYRAMWNVLEALAV